VDIIRCIVELIPGWKGMVKNNSYNGIMPNKLETRPLPTLEDLTNVWPIIEAREAAAILAEQQKTEARNQAIIDTLPTWAQVSTAVDGITNLAEAKVFIKKLAQVVYWLAKDSAT
jgi:hypothetical protein